jgi:hypothetical protein
MTPAINTIVVIYHCPRCCFECDGETSERDFQRDRPACPECEAVMTSLHADPVAWRAANAELHRQQCEATMAFEITHRLAGTCDFTTQWLDAARLENLLLVLNRSISLSGSDVAAAEDARTYLMLFNHILARDRAN